MILFTQEDFCRIGNHLQQELPDQIARDDGQPFGVRATITLRAAGKVWSTGSDGAPMIITLRVCGKRVDRVVHVRTVDELRAACREAGV